MHPQRSLVIQGSFPAGGPRVLLPVVRPGQPAKPVVQPAGPSYVTQLDPTRLNLGGAGGSALPEAVQRKMETFFKTDFSDVRVFMGPQASSIGALAFTLGSNIYFAPGQYNPQSVHGQQLLGHELAHVLQQRAGRVRNPQGSGVAVVQDPHLEAEADRLGRQAAVQPMMPPGGAAQQRAGLVQAKPAASLPGARPMAPHVQAAVAAVGQPKLSVAQPGGRPLAPHVQAAVAAGAQPKFPNVQPGGRPLAPHVQAAVSGVGPSAPPAFRARGGAQVVQRQVIQMDDEDAREYIAANRIEWQGKVSKKKVEEYYNNTHNNEEHRRGLLAAWNRNAGKGQRIAEVAEEEQRRGMLAQKEKKDRETANKLQGDKLLPAALDTYQTRKLQGVAEISGFRICRHKRGLAVALSRATGKAESKAMKGTRQIERIAYADTYKWFSESQAHTEKFVNYTSGDTGATLAVWLEADRYIYIRQALEHEFLSSGAKVNRFHQENVSGHMMHLINIGIHPDKDAEFMAAVIDVKDLSTAAAEESFGVSVPTPQSAVASSPTTSGVDEEMQFAYLAGYSKNSFKQWRKSNQYLWYQDEAETFGSPIPPYCSQRLTARITRWRETGID